MPKIGVFNMEGQRVGEMELSDAVFGVPMNMPVVHQVVVAQLANKRQGTQSTLTRAQVRGGGAKPWRQKGTGRARQGSTRSPQWRTGGVVFAPKPRDYTISVPRKVKRLALRCALSNKCEEQQLIILDALALENGKTREMVKVLSNLKIDSKALVVLGGADELVRRASGNIQGIACASVQTLNTYDVMKHDKLIIVKDAVAQIEEVFA